jgi:hypothetical protein
MCVLGSAIETRDKIEVGYKRKCPVFSALGWDTGDGRPDDFHGLPLASNAWEKGFTFPFGVVLNKLGAWPGVCRGVALIITSINFFLAYALQSM